MWNRKIIFKGTRSHPPPHAGYPRGGPGPLPVLTLCNCAAILLVIVAVVALDARHASFNTSAHTRTESTVALLPKTLCAADERVIFSCPLRRPAKIVSVCSSKNLTKETGYLQYRFGLPGKIELEFPKGRQGSQAKFEYTHYFRAQVDLTEINFSVDGVNYSVFDEYNGEEKPAVSSQGVAVNKGEANKETRFVCRAKPKADYSDLQAVLETGQ
jgi:hypothetical protein